MALMQTLDFQGAVTVQFRLQFAPQRRNIQEVPVLLLSCC